MKKLELSKIQGLILWSLVTIALFIGIVGIQPSKMGLEANDKNDKKVIWVAGGNSSVGLDRT